jgi:hypothetical protein
MQKKAWPYMAGIMDSEGSISLSISRKSSGYEGFNLMLQATNTDRKLIDWIVSNFGGSMCAEIKKNSFAPGSKIFRWVMYGAENQEAFLLGLLPYLVIKKEQALVGLDFLRLGRGDNTRRRELWDKVKRLNQEPVPVPDVFSKSKKRAEYAAGYLDGDGSICGTYHRGLNISIVSTDFVVIKWLMANYGGRFHARQRNPKHKLIYQWFVSGSKNKEKFLLDVIPHLLLKRDRAKMLLEIIRLRQQDLFGRDAEISHRIFQLNEKIRSLNSGEDSATTDTLSVSEKSEIKTQSGLAGDSKSAFVETQEAIN